MYSRETTLQGPYDPQGLVEKVQSVVVPRMMDSSGFRGLYVTGDPDTGTAWLYTDWETVGHLIASRQDANEVRTQAAGSAVVGVRDWHVPVEHVSDQPPTAGLPVNVNLHLYDPTIIHEVVSFFAWAAEPMYSSSPGLRSVRMLVDRTTGEVQVGSVWDDVESLENGFSRTSAVRDRAVAKGMRFVDRSRREVLFYYAR